MAKSTDSPGPVQVAQESVLIGKKVVETGRVRVSTVVERDCIVVDEDIEQQGVEVERVKIDRDVEHVPASRQEGDVLIVPIVEEYVFVEKRLRLKEELHIRTVRTVNHVQERVPVRRLKVMVQRAGPDGINPSSGDKP